MCEKIWYEKICNSFRRKKWMAGMAAAALVLGACACGGDEGEQGGSSGAPSGGRAGIQTEGRDGTQPVGSSDGPEEENPAVAGGSETQAQSFRYLCDPDNGTGCTTAEGYYYLTEEGTELAGGEWGTHLMYMDYASGKEVYLCSTSGCSHNTPDCPAVLLDKEFPIYTTRLFIYENKLYILSRQEDQGGTMSIDMQGSGEGTSSEPVPAAFYRANLDGTDRRAVYTFDGNLTLEDLVLGDEKGIYLITKEVSMEQEGNASYGVSARRRLVCLEPDEGSLTEVCSMEFEDKIDWKVIGCGRDRLVLSGVDYGRELSREEFWDDDHYKEFYLSSQDVYALLDPQRGSHQEILRLPNSEEHSEQVLGNTLYYSDRDSGRIKALDLATGEEKTLCELTQNMILDTLGELLCCRTWDMSSDYTYYFVDTGTGEVSHSGLVNLCNGWDLTFKADCGDDVLAVYDYDAQDNGDGSYEIFQEYYALISKEDLLAGRENYRKIDMVERGR